MNEHPNYIDYENLGPDPTQDDNRTESEKRIRYGNNRKKVSKDSKRARAKIAAKSRRVNRR